MSRRITIAFLAVAICALSLPAMASEKNPVERPHKVWGNITLTITAIDWDNFVVSFEFVDIGHATHLGRYTDEAQGSLNLFTLEIAGTAEITAANGDTIECSFDAFKVTFESGTGRFEGVSGEVFLDYEPLDFPLEVGAVVSYPYTGTGWIKY